MNAKFSQEQAAFATLLANQDGYKRVFCPTATLTLTQSGLLAVLLERQHYTSQLARHRARRDHMHNSLWKRLARLLHARAARKVTHDAAKPWITTIPRHT